MTTARRVALLTLCALAALLPLNGLTAGRAQPPAAITIGTTDLPRSLDLIRATPSIWQRGKS